MTKSISRGKRVNSLEPITSLDVCYALLRPSLSGAMQLKESSMKINGVKAGIAANDKKIGSLLKMVVTS